MVHGISGSLQYEIHLTQHVDFFDDILPICIDVRELFTLKKTQMNNKDVYKLIIISNNTFEDILNKNNYNKKNEIYNEQLGVLFEYLKKYTSVLYYDEYNGKKINDEDLKYINVVYYKDMIKHIDIMPNICTKEELDNIQNELNQLKEIWHTNNDLKNKYVQLFDTLKIQKIINNVDYFKEIVELEKKLTNFELTNDMQELINKVISHPKLKNIISWHGISLIEYNF